jgi:hypothetical protein
VLRPPAQEPPEAFDDDGRAERRRTEPSEPEAFIPLSADVAPQLALFGGGPPAPVPVSRPPTVAFAGSPAVEEPADLPTFKRRAALRDKRHGLVRTLAGMQNRSFREINTWLNRETGAAGVGSASIEQIEASIDLLLAELDRLSRRRAS